VRCWQSDRLAEIVDLENLESWTANGFQSHPGWTGGPGYEGEGLYRNSAATGFRSPEGMPVDQQYAVRESL